jgi:hypothetical protein
MCSLTVLRFENVQFQDRRDCEMVAEGINYSRLAAFAICDTSSCGPNSAKDVLALLLVDPVVPEPIDISSIIGLFPTTKFFLREEYVFFYWIFIIMMKFKVVKT